jgi:hypothetical protein
MRRVVLVFAVALAGCQSKPVEQMSYSEVRALAHDINKRCNDQGVFGPSAEFDACTRQEISREKSIRAANYARRQSAVACRSFPTGGGFSTTVCN